MTTVSIIICTTCETRRKDSLLRAIDSVVVQTDVTPEVIVVVNGNRFDATLLASLRANTKLKVAYLETPSFPAALSHGRALVTSEYFCFLDDDDEYLANALATRVRLIVEDSALDAVTTNGYAGTNNELAYSKVDHINGDPILALANNNWLASCGGLYRTQSIGRDIFENLPKYIEWTMVAFRILLAGKRLKFCNVPTFHINDTTESLSKSESYRMSAGGSMEAILELRLPARTMKPLKRRLMAARHDLSVHHLQTGNRKAAWKYHLLSMTGLSGLKYLSFTRHLLF